MTDRQWNWRMGVTALAVFGAFILGYMVAIHQTENMVAGGVTPTREMGTVAAVQTPLPQMVIEYLTADCHEVSVASALAAAEAFSLSAHSADAEGPLSYRALYATGAVDERLKALTCVLWWLNR